MSDLQMPFHAWKTSLRICRWFEVDRTLLSNGGEPFSFGQSPEHRGCCRKLLQTIMELSVIQDRFTKNPVFRMNQGEASLVARAVARGCVNPNGKWNSEIGRASC